ncbi:MAG TPA: metal ABC transporter ATP-binding protein [Pseudonocardiaceae bacterium]|nr:metal ABC transporter ATP-binding protein [Pseudonocardiaceae bacterium]
MSRDVVSLRGVGVTLAGRRVLDGVSFAIHTGQFTGLIGANGAGKTTLLRVILGLQATGSGAVHADRRSIGYVPQQVALDPDLPLRARDLVALGADGHRLGVPLRSRARRERVADLLAAVGAEHVADARAGTLSGGERQRVLIAHALVSRPALLVLDEPLANLDIRGEHEIVELVAQVCREQHVAVLITTHDMNPLLPVMDRVVYLAHGKAVSGTTDEVVRADVLSALYGHSVEVVRVHGRVLVYAGSGEPAIA